MRRRGRDQAGARLRLATAMHPRVFVRGEPRDTRDVDVAVMLFTSE